MNIKKIKNYSILFSVLFVLINFIIFVFSDNLLLLSFLAILDIFLIIYFFQFLLSSRDQIDEIYKDYKGNKFLDFFRDGKFALPVFFFLLVASFFLFYFVKGLVDDEIKVVFNGVSEDVFNYVKQNLEDDLDVLKTVEGLYVSSELVTKEEFNSFISSQEYFGKNSEIQSVKYIEKISDEEDDNFYYKIINLEDSDWGIRYEIFVDGYEGVISKIDSGEYIKNARDTSDFSVSSPIDLNEEESKGLVFAVFYPVYKNGLDVKNILDRRKNIQGVLASVFKYDEIFDSLIKNISNAEGLYFILSDDQQNIFDSSGGEFSDHKSELEYINHIAIGGRVWQFKINSTELFFDKFNTEERLPYIILISNILLAILISSTLFLVSRKEREAKILAQIMTDNFENAKKDIIKKNEQALIDEKKFSDTFKNSAIGLAVVDVKGKFIDVNKTLCSILGYKKEELIKKTFQEITHPDDLETDLDYMKKMLDGEIDTYQMEKRYFDKDGNIVWAVLTGTIVKNIDGSPDYFIAQIQDITEIKKVSNDLEKFKEAVENATDQIVITDPDGTVIYANRAMEKTTGYSIKEALGKKAAALWKTPMPDSFYKELWKTIKEDKKPFISEIKNKHKEGYLYDVSISIFPVLDDKNEIIFFVSIERDITEEKNIDKAKTEFVSVASHQLRTPLSAISWYTEMLLGGEAGKVTKKQKDFLGEIYEGSRRMTDLVNSLLNISRIELGTFVIEPEETNLLLEIDKVLPELEIFAKENKIKINKNISDNIPKIKLDKNLFRIIIQNLLSNAIKYTKEDGQVDFIVKNNKTNLIIDVKDNGIGIPKNQQKDIYKKLFRASNAKLEHVEGTGLGLYVVKMILDNSGGSISFKSKEKEGTTFTVKIPLSGMKMKKGKVSLS